MRVLLLVQEVSALKRKKRRDVRGVDDEDGSSE